MLHRTLPMAAGLIALGFVLGGPACQGTPPATVTDLAGQGAKQMGDDRSDARQGRALRGMGEILQREAASQRRQRERGN